MSQTTVSMFLHLLNKLHNEQTDKTKDQLYIFISAVLLNKSNKT